LAIERLMLPKLLEQDHRQQAGPHQAAGDHMERCWRLADLLAIPARELLYDSVSEARKSIGRYLDFYNGRRPHSNLDRRTPDQVHFTPLPIRMAA
jgi:transposase InsO family protein